MLCLNPNQSTPNLSNPYRIKSDISLQSQNSRIEPPVEMSPGSRSKDYSHLHRFDKIIVSSSASHNGHLDELLE